ncbi:MAG: hypothetical protein J5697_00550 [Clostridia bacterium]|nr:hypothetical protein [Clostridia bacterium]
MQYENSVLMLKQTASGFSSGSPLGAILRLENENGVFSVFLSTVNFALLSSGTYLLFLSDGKNFNLSADLGKKPTSANYREDKDIRPKDVSAGICFYKDGLPVLVAFSESENGNLSLKDFKKRVAEYFYKELKDKKKNEEVLKAYNDEAVATENYYAYKEDFDEPVKTETESEYNFSENGENSRRKQSKKQKEKKNAIGSLDEENSFAGEEQRFYSKVKAEIESTLNKYPHETVLETIFKDSRWVKINYSATRYYVLGVIKENGREKYVCYGVPDKFSEYAPKELDGYCSFIPLSVFDLSGNGYWMMFQDADTGECLKRN